MITWSYIPLLPLRFGCMMPPSPPRGARRTRAPPAREDAPIRRARAPAAASRAARSSVADAVVADAPAAVELEVALAHLAQEHDDARRLAVDHAGDARHVRVHDGARVGAGPDVVPRVVGVDHVAAVARADRRRLRARLPAEVVVGPDDIAVVAADDRVVAVAAE